MANLEILNKISSPINDHGIKLLTFRRIYNNGKLMHLSNDERWLKYSCDNQLWQSTSSLKRILNINPNEQYFHVWSQNAHTKDMVYGAMYHHNLCNGITIYDKRDEYVDLWAFVANKPNNDVLDLYINHIEIIKRFILYLHDKAHSIFFPKSSDIYINTGKEIIINSPENKLFSKRITPTFDIKKFYLDHSENLYLTQQEFKCLLYISRSYNCKEIASLLKIKPCTVETHIKKIKTRLDSNGAEEMSKDKLIEKCQHLLNMYN